MGFWAGEGKNNRGLSDASTHQPPTRPSGPSAPPPLPLPHTHLRPPPSPPGGPQPSCPSPQRSCVTPSPSLCFSSFLVFVCFFSGCRGSRKMTQIIPNVHFGEPRYFAKIPRETLLLSPREENGWNVGKKNAKCWAHPSRPRRPKILLLPPVPQKKKLARPLTGGGVQRRGGQTDRQKKERTDMRAGAHQKQHPHPETSNTHATHTFFATVGFGQSRRYHSRSSTGVGQKGKV